MEDYAFQIIRPHIVAVFVILIFSILLLKRKSFKNTEVRFFWLTVLSCLFLVLADIAEAFCSEDPSLRFFRTFFLWPVIFSIHFCARFAVCHYPKRQKETPFMDPQHH